ncbi:hypothetical protein [uncultured Ruminococcus sp.]|uniref:hypothetical protein n=1 Tax=uncultured Ruminococcus sp. TaxID=165186 RepID=UPI002631217D|nr:hypothetical protein [uncultured Ruminococcus sp.]
MRVFRAFLRYTAAQLLSLFVNIMLAAAGGTLISAICLVCTFSVMVCVLADFGINEASADCKKEKHSESRAPVRGMLGAAAAVTAVPFISRVLLCISRGGAFEFYGLFKLLDPSFLRLYNFIEPSASAADLSMGELAAIMPAAAVPACALLLSYAAALKSLRGQDIR